jgi:hypothetical protein
VTDQTSPEHSIERFAELVALVDDGLTPRSTVLRAAELDADAWRRIEGQWMARLAAGDEPDIALRFARRYGLTRQSFSTAAAGEGGAPLPQMSGTDVDDTLPDVPEGVISDGPDLAPASYPPAAAGDLVRTAADPTDVTIGCTPDAASKRVLPFVPPGGPVFVPSPAPPGKRLARFDTQTGQPLPVPIWVDEPVPPVSPCGSPGGD